MKRIFFIFMLCYFKLCAQQTDFTYDSVKIQQCKSRFTQVEYVSEIENPLLAALDHFPELETVNISFKYKNIKTTMVSRPTFFSLFHKRRSFVIYIDNYVKENNGIDFQSIPNNAKIGLIGHELCHILDYQTKSSLQIFGMGIKYVFSKNHYEVESHVDKLTIQKGLGPQLYAWTDYILNVSEATEKYKSFKKINYLALAEILLEIEKLNLPAE